MKIVGNVLFVIAEIIAFIFGICVSILVFQVVTYAIIKLGVPINENIYVLDDLLLFFEELNIQ